MRKARTFEIGLAPDQVELLDLGIFDVLQAWAHSPEQYDLKALARNCYLQGLVDGSNPEIVTRLNDLKAST